MIYLASSWKNEHHTRALAELRAAGFEVYDFKNPKVGDTGFGWSQVDKTPRPWTLERLRDVLASPRASEGFASDFGAMKDCTACVLLLPCGRSAHLEAGWFAGAGRRVIVLAYDGTLIEPELMYGLTDMLATEVAQVAQVLNRDELGRYPLDDERGEAPHRNEHEEDERDPSGLDRE